MEIILHCPKQADGIYELEKRAAEIHSEAVFAKLQKTNFSSEERKRIFDLVKEKYTEKMKM